MNQTELLQRFPLASRAFIEANTDQPIQTTKTIPRPVSAQKKGYSGNIREIISQSDSYPKTLRILVTGQILGGKNNMIVTRSGLHFPKKSWAKWRDEKVAEVKAQLPPDWTPLDQPCNLTLHYIAGDRRRRDFPAIVDSLWHVLEKAGVVADDTLLWITSSTRGYDKDNPFAELLLEIP